MDQAKKLREIMNNIKQEEAQTSKNLVGSLGLDQAGKNLGKVISISSGKGGVGKTNFALNLSISLSRIGYKVIVLDADIGLSNIEILSGTSIPYSILDIINKQRTVEEIISPGPEGVDIISGGSGLKDLVLTNKYNLKLILKELTKLQSFYDYVVIDTGAGISDAVLDFALSADETLIVATPDPTSIMDAYVLIKSLKIKAYTGKMKLVVNMAKNSQEGFDTYSRINGVVSQFLHMELEFLGSINKDDSVVKSIRMQTPFIIGYPNKKPSLQVMEIRDNLLRDKSVEAGRSGFGQRLINFFLS